MQPGKKQSTNNDLPNRIPTSTICELFSLIEEGCALYDVSEEGVGSSLLRISCVHSACQARPCCICRFLYYLLHCGDPMSLLKDIESLIETH